METSNHNPTPAEVRRHAMQEQVAGWLGIRGGYRTRHRRHWWYAAALVATAAGAELAEPDGWLRFGQMLLLAAAAAQVAIGRQVLERGRDEPVFEQLLRGEESRLLDDLWDRS